MAGTPVSNQSLRRFEVRSADSLLSILDAGQVGLWEWNVQTGENLITTAWAAQLGLSVEDLSPFSFDAFIELIHPEDHQQVTQTVQQHLSGETDCYLASFRMRHYDNTWVWIEARGQVTKRLPNGQPLLMSGIHRNISDLKKVEEELRQRSNTDAMTGWYNRAYFLQAGAVIVSRALRQRSRLALLMFDIDHFKSINDQFGHATGDCVIETLCGQIGARLRAIDIAGRLGGEEFAILLDGASLGDARNIAESLRESIASVEFTSPQQQPFQVTASFGVTMIDDHNDCIESLLSRADAALYQAKANGRNRTELA